MQPKRCKFCDPAPAQVAHRWLQQTRLEVRVELETQIPSFSATSIIASISEFTQRWQDQNRFGTAQIPHSRLPHVTRLQRKQTLRVSARSSSRHRIQNLTSPGSIFAHAETSNSIHTSDIPPRPFATFRQTGTRKVGGFRLFTYNRGGPCRFVVSLNTHILRLRHRRCQKIGLRFSPVFKEMS